MKILISEFVYRTAAYGKWLWIAITVEWYLEPLPRSKAFFHLVNRFCDVMVNEKLDFFPKKLAEHYVEVIFPFYLREIQNFSHRRPSISVYGDSFEKGDFAGAAKLCRKSVWDWFLEEAFYSQDLGKKIIR